MLGVPGPYGTMSRVVDPREAPAPVAVMTGRGAPVVGEAAKAASCCEMTAVDEQLSISALMKGTPGRPGWPR